MFSHADRFPLGPNRVGPPGALPSTWLVPPRPWGLSRMEPFRADDSADEDWTVTATELDPATQLTRYRGPDGMISMSPGKHRRTNTGTERATQTQNPGDRKGPTTDQDHSQDHDND
jgi:putative ATP-grasp target RiPP